MTTQNSLSKTAARGGTQALAGQWSRYLLQLASFIVLAHLIPPKQFGLVAMITAIVGIAEVLRDFGLSSAAMQAIEINDRQQSALFWMNSVFGGVLTLLVIALSHPIASFYGNAELSSLIILLAPVFLMNGVSAQLQAQLARTFMYRQIATADAASMAIGFAVGVAAAIARPNAWCLVYMQLAVAVSRTAILALHSDLRPTTLKATGLGSLVRFGRNVVIVQMLDYASRNIDTVLVGKYWGAFDVGIYTRAYQLLMLPLQQVNAPLTRVALPVLSRIKNDRERYTRYIEFAVLVTSTVGMIIFGYLAVCSTDLISVLLGSKWIKAGPIFQAMCFAGVLQAVSYVNYWQFMSLGRTGAHVRYSLIAKPLVVIGFVIAAPHGVTAVAWSYTLTTALVTPIGFWVAGRGQSNGSGLSLLVAGCKILPLAATAMIATAAVRHADLSSNIFLSLLISTVTYVAALGITTAAIPAYRNLAFSMYALFRDGGRGTGAHSQPQHAASR